MKTPLILTAAIIAGAGILATTAAASQDTWIRNDTQKITVEVVGGKLMCTRNSDGFELCHGMSKQADGSWAGTAMKHPDLPDFLTLNGTVIWTSGLLKIKGCVFGQSVCDVEIWTKKP